MGNGLYEGKIQYKTVANYAYSQGLIDEHVYNNAQKMIDKCIYLINNK